MGFDEMLRSLRQDYIEINKRRFRFGTLPYWIIRFIQGATAFGYFYLLLVGVLALA